jgi:IclR family acetate operon transcriptional repressor
MPPPKTPKTVRAVDRAIDILRSFSPEQPMMSVLELQKKLRLSRPTLYRLLHTLAVNGMIKVVGEPQRYRLDHGVARIAHVWLSQIDARQLAGPILEALREATGETVALFVLEGEKRLCVQEFRSRHALGFSRGIGETEHIAIGASGKAMLAFMPEAAAAGPMRGLPRTVDRSALLAELAQVRALGFAKSVGEVFVGATAVAAPFFDQGGRVAGSIGLFGPEARLGGEHLEQCVHAVIAAAARLSGELGAQPSTAVPAAKKRRRGGASG